MIIQLQKDISKQQIESLHEKLQSLKVKAANITTQHHQYIVGILQKEIDVRVIGQQDGVQDVFRVNDSYKLVSSKWKMDPSVIDLGDDVLVGGKEFTLMAGPCSIENEAQIETVVNHLKQLNVKIMRGGVFKPRSSPYAFRGLGIDGLKMFYKICKQNGIKIITEVMQVSQIDEMIDYVDIFQVGARNTQNFNLLDALGKVDKTVMIKRGISGTIDELLQSAEYVFAAGNEKIILCERGIRTFENVYRNTFDINAIPILKEKSHLPVIADPSHGIGIRKHVATIALAAQIAGADGVIVEIHHEPEKAFSDGAQTLSFDEFSSLVTQIRTIENTLKNLN
jgi:3-deoxy-7-phosphoheptulonate synthase